MADIFDTWKRASYGGIEFPFTDFTITADLRHHVHEYLKRPGAEVETLGRRAYVFDVRMKFVDVFEGFADLYPSRLSALMSLYESEKAYDLWVPPMERSFKCKMTRCVRSVSAAMRSGEDVTFSFIEDSTERYTTLNLIGVSRAAITPKAATLTAEVTALEDTPAIDALTKLIEKIDEYLTAIDLVSAEIDYQTARIDGVVSACGALANVPVMQTAFAAPALVALTDLWALAIAQQQAEASTTTPMLVTTTELAVMSVIDLSMAFYGSPGRSAQLMRINTFDNPLAIPRGTTVHYLAS